jgi:hypothetical protein
MQLKIAARPERAADSRFLASIRERADKDKISRDLKNRSHAIQVEQANSYFRQRSLDEPRMRLHRCFVTPCQSRERDSFRSQFSLQISLCEWTRSARRPSTRAMRALSQVGVLP